MNKSFEFVHVRSGFVPDAPNFFENIASYGDALNGIGGQDVAPDTPASEYPRIYVMDTGGTEQQLLDLFQCQLESNPKAKALLVAHPAYNSLPASLEVLARLQQDGQEGQILFLDGPQDSTGLSAISNALGGEMDKRPLKGLRVGLVGAPSDWLVASSPNPELIQKTWGPSIVSIDIADLQNGMTAITPEEAQALAQSLVAEAREVQEPGPDEISDVVKVYLALKALVDTHDLDALSLRCFDLVLDQKTTGCFALSELIDGGVIAGCEGDLVSTLGMLWAQKETGEIPWMANPAHLNPSDNRLTLAHCTVPRNMVSNYGLRSHFESGLGVGIQGQIPTGPVTLLRLGGKALDKVWLAEGQIESAGNSDQLCRTQVHIQLSTGTVAELLESPLGNHIVMVKGHHEAVLQTGWQAFHPTL